MSRRALARRRSGGAPAAVPLLALLAVTALLGAGACSANRAVSSGQPGAGAGAAGDGEGGSATQPTLLGGGDLPTDKTPVRGGKLVIAVSAETDSFQPFRGQWSVPSFTVANAFFDPLAAIDSQGIAHPNLAAAIEPGPGFTTWTIKVRPDVLFHDGSAFDAAALKKNLDAARSSGLTSQAFTTITGVEITAPDAVTVMLSEPWATFPATLASQAGYMAAPAMLDDPAGLDALPIGTGPFAVVDRIRDSVVRTSRNPNYWRTDSVGQQLPYLDAVDFQVVPDSGSRGNALAAGDVDAIGMVTPELILRSRDQAQRGEIQLLTDDGRETDESVLAFNTSKPPFDDPLARQVVAAAIDQEGLSTDAYQGAFPPAWGMFESGSQYYLPPATVGYGGHDLERARALAAQYAEAHGSPLAFTSLVPADTQYLAIGQAVQQQLAEVGVKVELESVEQTQLIRQVVATGDFEAAGFLLRSAPSPDQSYVFLATKANPSGLSLNFSRLDDEVITNSMKAFRAAADPAARVEALGKVQRELASALPMVFLVHNRSGFAYRTNVHGMQGTTFPGSQRPATAPSPTTPFLAAAWKE